MKASRRCCELLRGTDTKGGRASRVNVGRTCPKPLRRLAPSEAAELKLVGPPDRSHKLRGRVRLEGDCNNPGHEGHRSSPEHLKQPLLLHVSVVRCETRLDRPVLLKPSRLDLKLATCHYQGREPWRGRTDLTGYLHDRLLIGLPTVT